LYHGWEMGADIFIGTAWSQRGNWIKDLGWFFCRCLPSPSLWGGASNASKTIEKTSRFAKSTYEGGEKESYKKISSHLLAQVGCQAKTRTHGEQILGRRRWHIASTKSMREGGASQKYRSTEVPSKTM